MKFYCIDININSIQTIIIIKLRRIKKKQIKKNINKNTNIIQKKLIGKIIIKFKKNKKKIIFL